jgi:hypothetical protein
LVLLEEDSASGGFKPLIDWKELFAVLGSVIDENEFAVWEV